MPSGASETTLRTFHPRIRTAFFICRTMGMVAYRAPSPAVCGETGGTMPAFICTACGTQYPPSEAPPAQCPVCEDERQFLPPEGQSWTTLDRLRISHHNGFRQHEPGQIGRASCRE